MSQLQATNKHLPKRCRKAYQANHYLQNRERILARMRRRYAEDPEKKQIKNKAWASVNKERLRLITKRYRLRNAEKARESTRRYHAEKKVEIAAYKKEYWRRNRDMARASFHKRRAALIGATINASGIREFVARIYATEGVKCYYCRKEIATRREIHFDHIVPLSRGGEHSLGNLCVSCRSCNCKKSFKMISELRNIGQQLLPL